MQLHQAVVLDQPLVPSQTSLVSLVDELLLTIIDHIDSKETLCNLAATCPRFQGLVEPYIWRSLLVTKGCHARQVASALDSRDARCSHVTELSIRYPDLQREGIEALNHFIGLMDRLRHLTIESPCPNNNEWSASIYFDGSTRIDYWALLEAAVRPRPGLQLTLQMLQSLTLHGHGPDDRKFTFGRCAVMFLHPTLRRITLSCTNFDADMTHATIPARKKKSTPLKSLTLIECNVNVKFLDVVLSLPKALKELDIGERLYVFAECLPSHDLSTRTSRPLFLKALTQQAHSLERLSHISGDLSYITLCQNTDTSTARLSDLAHLKFLELGIESTLWAYLEQNDYPATLRTLKVNDTAWANSVLPRGQFAFHPQNVLKRCTEVISKYMTHPIDLDIRFTNAESILILTTIPTRNIAALIPSVFGGPIRAPLYKLSTFQKSRGVHLRLFAHAFSASKPFIPPFMYGEEEPREVKFYDSDDFWRVCNQNFRVVDDEKLKEEVGKLPKLTCAWCVVNGKECFNAGDGGVCIHCENVGRTCEYI